MPLCWYHYHRRIKTIAAVPYKEDGEGEAILLGGLAFRRTMDDRVEVVEINEHRG